MATDVTVLGLEFGTGLSAAAALVLLAVFWRYSALDDVAWEEVAAGVMLFVVAAGVDIMAGPNGLAAFLSSATALYQLVSVLHIVAALLVVTGALRNAYVLLAER